MLYCVGANLFCLFIWSDNMYVSLWTTLWLHALADLCISPNISTCGKMWPLCPLWQGMWNFPWNSVQVNNAPPWFHSSWQINAKGEGGGLFWLVPHVKYCDQVRLYLGFHKTKHKHTLTLNYFNPPPPLFFLTRKIFVIGSYNMFKFNYQRICKTMNTRMCLCFHHWA